MLSASLKLKVTNISNISNKLMLLCFLSPEAIRCIYSKRTKFRIFVAMDDIGSEQ